MTTIDAMPPLPTWEPGEDSAALGNAFLAALNPMIVQSNALNSESASGAAAAASSQSASAASLALVNKIASSTKWISGTSYAVNDVVWSPADFQTYLRLIAGAGTTDPSADPTNWAPWSFKAASGTFSALSIINGLIADTINADKLTASGPVREKYNEINGSVIDCGLGNWFGKAITGATTLTAANVPASSKAYAFVIELSRPGANITWLANTRWAQGSAPTDLTATGRAVVGYLTVDGGSTWSGFVLANNLPEIFWLNCLNAEALDSRVSLSRSSNGSYYDSTGTLQTAGTNVARKDYDPVTLAAKGLLIEENRTNSIRNNTMVGVVAGTPGTPPTNWGVGVGGGLSKQIVGSGTVKGVAYVDVRVFGTTTSTALALNLSYETATAISAAQGQVWAASNFLQFVGGSQAGITYIRNVITEESNVGADLTYNQSSAVTVSASSIEQGRSAYSVVLSNAATAFVKPGIWIGHAGIGTVLDFTIRIGMPQLELGAFVTSVIATSGAAATRSADIPSVTGASFSNWYNQSAGAFYVEADAITNGLTSANANAFPFLLDCDDGTANANTSHQILASAGYGPGLNFVVADGVAAKNQIQTTALPSALIKACLAYSQSNSRGAINGTLSTALAALASPPLTMSRLSIGCQNASAGNAWSGHIRKLRFYPRRIEDSCLQGLTA